MGIIRSRFQLITVAGATLVLLLLLAIPAVASAHSTSTASPLVSSSSQAPVKGATEISALINTINGFHLNPLVQQLLDSPLEAALKALNTATGGTKAACSDLANFTGQVGLQARKGLTIQQARQL